jgi:flagellar hook protein FlgE
LTIYDSVGNPTSLALRWAKTTTRSADGTVNDSWNAYYQTSTDRGATGNTIWKKFTTAEFNAAGNVTAPIDVTIPNLSVNGRVIGDVQFIARQADLTQYSDSSGTFQPGVIGQDGYPSGTLSTVSIDSKGIISGSYSNGRVVPLWQIDAYTFQNDDALDRGDGSAFRETAASGRAIADTNLKIVPSAIEQSNVDIAAEFAEMIQTQSAYSANAKVGTIAQQMLSDVLNMIR